MNLAERQYQRMIKLKPKRGAVYDRNGNELALSLDIPSVYARPRLVKAPFQTADKLSRMLNMPRDQILAKLKSKNSFVWLTRQVDPGKAEIVSNIKMRGIGIVNEGRRIYPHGSLASHILGFAGVDGRGLEGVERKYDEILRGEEHSVMSDFDALGRPISAAPLLRGAYTSAHFLYLTINKSIQYFVERELGNAVEESGADAGSAVVMVPRTGEILALANYPSYDPNVFRRSSLLERRNRAVTDMFEPGSTMKVFVAAIALEEKVATPRTRYDCENGEFKIGGRVIREAQGHRWKNLTLADIIKVSSNIGAAKTALQMGKGKLYQGLRSFGFGVPTGIDLPGEAVGLTQPREKWTPLTLSTVAFGQGISVTAIQLVTALSAIANGGKLMRPFIVRQEVDYRGVSVREFTPQAVSQVVSPETAAQVREMMVRVTDPDGTGSLAVIEGMRVAGKTGTAQKPDVMTGGYHPDQYVASFFGFAPADDPKLAVLVVMDNAKGSYFGGTVAAPLFRKIVTHALNAEGIRVTAKQQAPRKSVEVRSLRAVEVPFIRRVGDRYMIPSLRGLTMREVAELFNEVPVKVRFRGSGVVRDQNPPAESMVSAGATCVITFAQPDSESGI
ncbi:MAG: penicillin-binding protein [Deltaproteobacteria bacterium]|nr:penicillin-binding protein [Deltaproteobacteria bacterium]